jgi:phosphoribosylaminoimidazolecarboxamide formyltransferase/IMP cyclohydrolase
VRKITRALVSAYDKRGLVELCQSLAVFGVELLATGGSRGLLLSSGIKCLDVEDVTGFPQILGDRVKTLHPKIHGGILADRTDPGHVADMARHDIAPIDLVVVNLYPFAAKPSVSMIDVGGPAMIRAAAKNFADVCVVTEPGDYDALLRELRDNDCSTSLEFRRAMARKAFALTASYDAAVASSALFSDDGVPQVPGYIKALELRYGENNHQKAAFYTRDGSLPMVKLQGKELSYNNVVDAHCALRVVNNFIEPAVAIIKHNIPCGVALGESALTAYEKALAADSISAFGGIVAFNREVDGAVAQQIVKIFTEVVLAPGFTDEAREILAGKPNVRLLAVSGDSSAEFEVRSAFGGLLLQEPDNMTNYDMRCVTTKTADAHLDDALFAYQVCKYVNSNAIVVVRDGATLAICGGQTSRIESVKIALSKVDCRGAVLASDGFFPFADSIIAASEAGIACVVQPGGSINDGVVIEEANRRGIAMLITGVRCFKH